MLANALDVNNTQLRTRREQKYPPPFTVMQNDYFMLHLHNLMVGFRA